MSIKKTILIIFLICFVLGSVFTVIGLSTAKDYHESRKDVINARPEKVWEFLTDIESLPKHRPEIKKVEITGINDQGYRMWREYTSTGGFADFEITEQVSQEKIVMRMKTSSFGLTGQWVYELEPFDLPAAVAGGDVYTSVKITEDSTTTNVWLRAMRVILGRGRIIKDEFASLKKSLNIR